MNFAVLRRPRTQALLDGAVRLSGPSPRWLPIADPLGWALSRSEGHRDIASGALDGGEISISSFLQAKSRGAPLVALPIFLKRGLVQRSLFCSLDSPLSSPQQLVGKRIGVVSYTSSMAVWMRAILKDGYGLDPATIEWITLGGPSHTGQSATRSLAIPEDFSGNKVRAWEELDGYPHELDRRESFLLSLLKGRTLDAVVSFQARIEGAEIRPLMQEESLWSDPINARIYPINHLFVFKADAIEKFPSIADSLRSAFLEARRLWKSYLPEDAQEPCEREMANLGYDPFAYRLDETAKRTLQTLIDYMQTEKLIYRKLEVAEFLHSFIR